MSCGALWLFLHFVGRALYAFDSHQVFFWLYAVSLLLLGIGARVPAAGRLTIRRFAKGAGLGLLAGLYRLRDPYAQGGDHAYRISRAMVTGRQR